MWRTVRRSIALAFLRLSEWLLARVGRRPAYGVLTLDLSGELSEQGGEQRLLGFLRRSSGDYLGLITLLRWAREDARLAGVLIRCDDLQVSWARLQGLRRSLQRLRAAGKQVWVHLERAGVGEYYLAAAADRVSLTPAATLDVTGLSSEAVFFLDALEKVGVEADVVQMGRYKSAGEAVTRRDMSPPHREMLEALIGDLYDQVVEGVAEGRRLAPDTARELLGAGPFVGAEALQHGLIDAVAYADQIEQQLTDACAGAKTIERAAYVARRGRGVRIATPNEYRMPTKIVGMAKG
ncbi:MAG: S49 family peptidase, partial [Candidatus Binatia bacterium]